MARPPKLTFWDRVVLKYLYWRRKNGWPIREETLGHYYGKAETSEERKAVHRIRMPWLYGRGKGCPRDTDLMEMRRLGTSAMVQLCIGTRQEEVKKTPWSIIRVDEHEKKYLLDTMNTRRDTRMLRKKKEEMEAHGNGLNALADEATNLLNNPSSQPIDFLDMEGMVIADCAEAGDAIWVLSFDESDIEQYHDNEMNCERIKIRKGARPVEIQPRDVLQFNKQENDEGVLGGYWHSPFGATGYGDAQVFLDTREVVWFHADLRANRHYGYGEVEKARDTIDILLLSGEQEAQYFSEGQLSPGALSIEDSSQAEMEEIASYYQEIIKGHPEKMWILPKKASWLPFTFNYKDLQFLERKLWDSKMIAGLFKLNLQVLGMAADSTNRATAFAEKLIAYEKGVAPQMMKIEHVINKQLIWRFYSKDLMFVYDPMYDPETKEQLHNTARQDYISGCYTLNEARTDMGQDTVTDGDKFKETPVQSLPGSFTGGEENKLKTGPLLNKPMLVKGQIRIRQFPPDKCTGKGYTVTLKDGVSAYVCPVGGKDKKQSIIFDKTKGWTRAKALAYCKSHGYRSYTSRETGKEKKEGEEPEDEDIEEVDSFLEEVTGGWHWIVYINGEVYDQGIAESEELARALISHHFEDAGEDLMDSGAKAVIDADAELQLPRRDARALYESIRKAYASAIDQVLEEIAKHKDDIEQMSESVRTKKTSATKAVNDSAIRGAVLEALRKAGLRESVVRMIIEATKITSLRAMRGQSRKLGLDFDEIHEADAISRLVEHKMSYYNDIPDTLSDDVIGTLVDSIATGKSYQETTDKLRSMRDDFTRHRAETIVRTEIGRSRKEAEQIFGEQHADVLEKTWKSTHDSRTRPSHTAMDGKTVSVKEEFIVDYSLDNPKNPSAVSERYPGESKWGIDCRCLQELTVKKKSKGSMKS